VKVLFTTHPGFGHLNPMAPTAAALQRAGHDVAFACSASFGPWIERLGFRQFPAGLDWLEWESEAAFPELLHVAAATRHTALLRDVFADAATHAMVPHLLHICTTWAPDVIVRNDFEFAACIAAERLGIPDAAIGVDFFLSPQKLKPLVGEQLAYARSAWGLRPYPSLDMLYRNLYLSFVPPTYQFPDAAVNASIHAIQPRVTDAAPGECLPEWVEQMPTDRPTVYVSLGTAFNRESALFRMIIAALEAEPLNIIVTVGHTQDPESLGVRRPNVHICRYVPQSLLFGRCHAAVISGSSNTTITALSYGLPLVLIPLASTQPLHAMRCTQLGLGVALRYGGAFDGYFPGREASEQTIREAVGTVLGNPAYRSAATTMQTEIASLPEPDTAVPLLEQLAGAHRSSTTSGASR
jgi:UDP:flavonoid glycosyltransferase YjiC (YdhE family)